MPYGEEIYPKNAIYKRRFYKEKFFLLEFWRFGFLQFPVGIYWGNVVKLHCKQFIDLSRTRLRLSRTLFDWLSCPCVHIGAAGEPSS